MICFTLLLCSAIERERFEIPFADHIYRGILPTVKAAEVAFLERILKPIASFLNAEAARSLLKVRADSKDQARVSELAEKCNLGT